MAFRRPRARILEISTTSGNGPYALAGAADGSYNRFSAFLAVGDKTHVTVVEPGVAFWTGIATYSAANQITLTDVEETKGTFGAGTKEIFAAPLASTAAYPQDVSGAIVTGGSAGAYTVASYRQYDTLAHLDGNIIAFTPHATNAAGATLAIDGLAAKPLRLAPGVSVQSGVLIQGTPYTALYSNADGAFYLHGLGGNAYGVPLGGSLDYWGAAAPSSAFALMFGQAISRTQYPGLWTLFGTTYGPGDGSTTFNIPDCRGRVVAGSDTMGGSPAGRLTTATMNGTQIGSTGGTETVTLSTAQIPSHTHANTLSDPGHNHTIVGARIISTPVAGAANFAVPGVDQSAFANPSTTGITINNAAQGGGAAHSNVSPTICGNKLLRII